MIIATYVIWNFKYVISFVVVIKYIIRNFTQNRRDFKRDCFERLLLYPYAIFCNNAVKICLRYS